jgi:hypothetical protein
VKISKSGAQGSILLKSSWDDSVVHWCWRISTTDFSSLCSDTTHTQKLLFTNSALWKLYKSPLVVGLNSAHRKMHTLLWTNGCIFCIVYISLLETWQAQADSPNLFISFCGLNRVTSPSMFAWFLHWKSHLPGDSSAQTGIIYRVTKSPQFVWLSYVWRSYVLATLWVPGKGVDLSLWSQITASFWDSLLCLLASDWFCILSFTKIYHPKTQWYPDFSGNKNFVPNEAS